MSEPVLSVGSLHFYDAPAEIEGSPYWVDLWASENGYRIGLQIKPRTFRSASTAMYSGKAQLSQRHGHRRFREDFGGAVLTAVPREGRLDAETERQLMAERERLANLPTGTHPALP